MTVLHTGSTKQFAAGWDSIFSGRKASRSVAGKSAAKPTKRAAPQTRKTAGKRAKSRGK